MTTRIPEIENSTPLRSDPCDGEAAIGGDEDLCVEILARLPLKSLFRFTCVCRGWRSLIADDFLRRRLPLVTSAVFYRRSTDAVNDGSFLGFACTSSGDLRECTLEFFPFHQSSTIIDCCNGLLLCFSGLRSTFFVVSPITGRWAALPKPLRRAHLSALAFDPGRSPEFKVVSFAWWLARGAEVEVFSSETGEWAAHSLQFGVESDAMTATTRYSAGVLYILAYPNYAVCVNLEKNECDLIKLPEAAGADGRIDGSGDALHYGSSDGDGRLKVWRREQGQWALKHRIDVGGSKVEFMAVHPGREELVYLQAEGKLVAYDVKRKKKNVEQVKTNTAAHVTSVHLFPFSRNISDCLL